jgi:succinylarginine dihydrolase
MAQYCFIGNALGYPWVIYVCIDVINEHERVCHEHAYGPHDLQAGLYGRADTELVTRDRFPARFFLSLIF